MYNLRFKKKGGKIFFPALCFLQQAITASGIFLKKRKEYCTTKHGLLKKFVFVCG
jgi:hypothetical protein